MLPSAYKQARRAAEAGKALSETDQNTDPRTDKHARRLQQGDATRRTPEKAARTRPIDTRKRDAIDFAAAKKAFSAPPPASNESSVMVRSTSARKEQEQNGSGRRRLARESTGLGPSASRSESSRWIDQGRDDMQAYEYLCHCSEAQQWIEKCIGESLGGDIANMGEEMRNGIALAKLAKSFEPSCVPRIFVHPKLQFRHTDNINYYFAFVDKIRLPACFRFELTDLYEKKNFPKVVYCLHALSHYLAHLGRSGKVDDLVGKLKFNEDQLARTQRGINAAGGMMPSFRGVGQALAQEIGATAARALPPIAEPEEEDEPEPAPAPRGASVVRAPSVPAPLAQNKAAEAALQRARASEREKELQRANEDREKSRREREERIAALGREREKKRREEIEARDREREQKRREEAEERERTRAKRRQEIEEREMKRRSEIEARERERDQERERERDRIRREALAARERATDDLERESRRRAREEEEREREKRARALREQEEEQRSRALALDRALEERLAAHEAALERRLAEVARERELERKRLEEEREAFRQREIERYEREREELRARDQEDRLEQEMKFELERKRQLAAHAAELSRAQAALDAAEARVAQLNAEYMRREKGKSREFGHMDLASAEPARAASPEAAGASKIAREAARELGLTIVRMQAHVRGGLLRRSFYSRLGALFECEDSATLLQACCRGVLARRRLFSQLCALEKHTGAFVGMQACARAILAQRALLARIESIRMQRAAGDLVGIQAHIRGAIARHSYQRMRAAFARIELVRTDRNTNTQSMRAALSHRTHRELRKETEFVRPDMTAVQAQIRGVLARQDFQWWLNHLLDSEPVAVHLQSLIRGVLSRRVFRGQFGHYLSHIPEIIKIQSLFRARKQGAHYRALRAGNRVTLDTIRAFAHLLDDSDRDYEDELALEDMRRHVVQTIRENQAVEAHVEDLDLKIALLVKNKIGIEELIKARTERGLLGTGETLGTLHHRNTVLAEAGDPFSEHTLDRASIHRRELYQELFYMLQTRPEYLARLLVQTNEAPGISPEDRRQFETVILTIFGYAQKPREEYLLLRLLQRSIVEQLGAVHAFDEFVLGHPQFLKLIAHYSRGENERAYLCELLTPLVQRVIDDTALDLETDPAAIYRATINEEEQSTGQRSRRAPSADAHEALNDPLTRTVFIRHLQALRGSTDMFLSSIRSDVRPMPYGMRYIVRELFNALQSRFPDEAFDKLLHGVGYITYYRYLHPAIVAPESFEVTSAVLSTVQRKNLVEISQVLTQIALGRPFGEEQPFLQPLNEYVEQAAQRYRRWIHMLVDSCPDPEIHFGIDECVDSSGIDKPVIYISPNEIYAMHALLCNNEESLVSSPDDPLFVLLEQLGPPPPVATSRELQAARDSEISFPLVNRLTRVREPDGDAKALMVETKRLVLAMIKVECSGSLLDTLIKPVTDAEEVAWQRVLAREPPQLPSDAHLVDIHSLSYEELKAATLENMLCLEKLGCVRRSNGFQDMLNAIANDIQSKHRRRVRRSAETQAMNESLRKLAEQRRYMEDQIESYNSYIDRSMNAMQKRSRRRFVLPFSQQFFHQRSLKAAGKMPRFGSYKFSAARLSDKGVIVSIESASGVPADHITLVISSDEIGVFVLEAWVSGVMAGSTTFRMSELLEAQYNNDECIYLLDDTFKMNVNLLIHLINKKFYA
ncbi:iqgap- protein [Malassezia cuniculi]|uniref:Iqgap- protein n=1 Tax=Malassezia cuniculi TaxID=948313 RepID=A0AAF0J6F0_9BASI|nr:iqgap- protein [Malassezia cuniculi]